jgi:polysaccharide biosynthesis/export protein
MIRQEWVPPIIKEDFFSMCKHFFRFLTLVTFAAGSAVAQTRQADESLVIGPGDRLHIEVYDTPQFDQHPRVDDAGNVPVLFVGSVAVGGETPEQAAVTVSKRLMSEQVMRHPQVSVTIEQYATQNVSVIGQVNKPGSYPIETPRSIFAVLSLAGGLTPVAERNVIVRHKGEKQGQQTFLVADSPSGDVATDLQVFPGDTIIVPKASFVYVLGDVARPGGYPMSANDTHLTAIQVLAEAGSANKTAVLSNSRLLRKTADGYDVIPLNLSALLRGKIHDVPLLADDVIFVPFSYTKNFVLNAAAMATSIAGATLFIP